MSAICQDTTPLSSFSMANTTTSDLVPIEKELSSTTPSLAHEDEKTLGLSGVSLDQNDKREEVALDDATTVKATQDPGSPPGDGVELPPEPAVEHPGPAGKDYSILSVTQKRAIVLAASFASLFSPMATAIYCAYSRFRYL
jgi:hypothetical protein